VVHAQLDYVIALVVDRLRSWGASASLAPLEEASCTR
jgi:hypothetical protein